MILTCSLPALVSADEPESQPACFGIRQEGKPRAGLRALAFPLVLVTALVKTRLQVSLCILLWFTLDCKSVIAYCFNLHTILHVLVAYCFGLHYIARYNCILLWFQRLIPYYNLWLNAYKNHCYTICIKSVLLR